MDKVATQGTTWGILNMVVICQGFPLLRQYTQGGFYSTRLALLNIFQQQYKKNFQMISSIVFINHKGEILIYRVYKDDITRAEIKQFCTKVVARKENKENPIVNIDGTSFIHIFHKDIIILATTKDNINVGMTLYFLYQLVKICKAYFTELDENNIRKQFVLIYELLDEVIDYGLPQTMDVDILKQYIQEGELIKNTSFYGRCIFCWFNQATGATSWRAQGIFYQKNEICIDIIEHVNALISVKGSILRADVAGTIVCKTQLSGMPECIFGLNDKLLIQKEGKKSKQQGTQDKSIVIDGLKFHQCVKLLDRQRAITFIPPDGVFELMNYRITENIDLPFKIMPVVNDMGKRIEVRVNLKSIFDRTIFATNVALKVPCPKQTANANCKSTLGRAKFEPEQRAIVWRIKKFQGDTEDLLRCEIELTQSTSEKKFVFPPVSIEFQVPMFTASGLRVRFLKVIEEKLSYKPTKWIRYVTKGGEYQHRI